MNLEKFIDGFANQFDETDPSTISADTVFKSLDEWSSLTALSIISFVDEEYGISITGDDIQKAHTVVDLFKTIESIQKN
jgi:acyl carrier protein